MDYQDTIGHLARLTVLGTSIGFGVLTAGAQEFPAFDLPIKCTSDAACFLQNMVDMETGPSRRDPFCNFATYNGHKGTDIRRRNLRDLNRYGLVTAMADGVVTATRNSVRDHLVTGEADFKRVKGRECGNGVAIDHGRFGGARYTVQMCHLAQNSLQVKVGDRVKRGQPLGRMGLSGATEFPHIHFSVRKNGRLIDPLSGRGQDTACRRGDTLNSLLSQQALAALFPAGLQLLLEDGFANGPVDGKAVLKGSVVQPDQKGPLVYYAKFINLKKGDYLRLTIIGPGGRFARSQTRPLSRNKANFTAYTGKKGPVSPGSYTGFVELVRKGNVIERRRSNELRM